MSAELVFYVNGRKVVEHDVDPETTLAQYLRNKLGLTGTKLGCGQGGCGACTVMMSRYNADIGTARHFSVNACLVPICSLHGMAVTTVEGVGSVEKGLHPVQERLAKSHGSQCGFCTPGMVMSMYTLLRNDPQPSVARMEKAFDGNLCRCTGYRPILDGFRTFTKGCDQLINKSEFLPLDPSQDPIFPPELQRRCTEFDGTSLVYKGERVTWYRPTTLTEVLQLKSTHPGAKLVIGNTEIDVEMKSKKQQYPVMIACTHIPELLHVQHTEKGITFGASVTLSTLDTELKNAVKKYPEYQTRVFSAVVEMLRWFGSNQIRNIAGIAGNIMTVSPLSDLKPLFLACGAVVEVLSKDKEPRDITMNEDFYPGYRQTKVEAGEVIASITLPFTTKNEYFFGYKQAYRREQDSATVNAGMFVRFRDQTNVVEKLCLVYGGMAATTVMPAKAMKHAVGRSWDDTLVSDMCRLLGEDLSLAPGAHGGMTEYRCSLTTGFFFKFYLTVLLQLQAQSVKCKSNVASYCKSATAQFQREPSRSVQMYQQVDPDQPDVDPVGRPVPHVSAVRQATGQAVFLDDIPRFHNELHLALVCSSKAYANIISVDPSAALKMPGVHSYVSAEDVPGSNLYGAHKEEFFATKQVLSQGQMIGAIVADTKVQAQRAAGCVKVEYEELAPIITIKDAIKAGSLYKGSHKLQCGDVDVAWQQVEHVLEGETHLGGQEHFFMETHACIAVPRSEEGEMELISSTQQPSSMQHSMAEVLGVPASRVTVRVKRIGGAFGGKQSRSYFFSTACAVAARKLGRPVRVVLDRDEDMRMSGNRHPFYAKYKVGFTADGKLVAIEMELYNNGGMTSDLSLGVIDKALFHCVNAYKVPNLRATGRVCKTNIPSNTAFRGFGTPEGAMIMEQVVSEIAIYLGIPAVKVRELNLYQDGDRTHYGQQVLNCQLQRCWDECRTQCNFQARKAQVDVFNSENRWKKRGITMVPTMAGIAYTAAFLNQAGVLVHVYQDGSVLLAHGGVEMGQGLNTKMIQVASKALGVPMSKVYINETCTSIVPNASPTGASATSDIYGAAILNACETLLERLQPVKQENPEGLWENWIKSAYEQRISLSTTGFYWTPDIGFSWETMTGNVFNYFSFGVACSEVEIDCLTGDHKVLRTDIVMDVGASLNPAIDVGQIEGAFAQGYGWMMMEQLKVSSQGLLFTQGPGNYKIPGVGDIPVQFNVSLLKGTSNPRAVYSSKAIGEPPLCLASSVYFAAKEAILSAREDAGHHGRFRLDSPATPERIRMACQDQFTELFPAAPEGSYTPWFVEP